MGERKRRRFTEMQRKAVVETVRQKGVCAAAEEHGVTPSCVSRWAKDAGVQRESAAVKRQRHAAGPPARTEPPRDDSVALAETAGASQDTSSPKVSTSAAPTVAWRDDAAKVRRPLRTRVARVYTPSQKAVILEDAAADGVTDAAEKQCDWHGQQTGGESPTRGPDGGNPTPRRQGHVWREAGARWTRRTPFFTARACLVEVVGARHDPNRVKRREASASGRLAASSESPVSVGGAGVVATGGREVCCLLPSEICRVPRQRR